jgi:tetratricopeptide (TPR) repeat protein
MLGRRDHGFPGAVNDRYKVYFLVAAAIVVSIIVYWPALAGSFVFDDLYLPFSDPGKAKFSLWSWLLGQRPLLMLSYWVNYRTWGLATIPYHAVNLALHLLTGCLVYLIVLKLQEYADLEKRHRYGLSLFAAGLFLLHPIQTEAVAYVAGRSDSLSTAFAYGAFALFLYGRTEGISPLRTTFIVLLFGCACLSKENVIVLPALFLLTDLYWARAIPAEVIQNRIRIYAVLCLVATLAGLFIAMQVLPGAETAGFHIKGLTIGQYSFTEFRAVWIYARLFFLPFAQCADYDFPLSRVLYDPAAVVGLAGLVAIMVVAVLVRNRYRLASYGLFVFLLLLAPTSSIFPLVDPLVERRLYLPSLGLLLILTDFLSRWRHNRAVLAGAMSAILVFAALLSYRRNKVWNSPLALWKDTVKNSPHKFRPRFQLAYAYAQAGQCVHAVEEYEEAARLERPDYRLLVDWALACDCAGQAHAAIARLKEAASLNQTAHVYSQIGLIYAKHGERTDALAALNQAERIDPEFEATYVYRGILYAQSLAFIHAEAEFRRALALNPNDVTAKKALEQIVKRRGSEAK